MATSASGKAGGQIARRAAASPSKRARASPTQQVFGAALRAVSAGIERYLPLGVGVLVVGIPLISVAWLAHLVLGIPTWAAGLASLSRFVIAVLRRG